MVWVDVAWDRFIVVLWIDLWIVSLWIMTTRNMFIRFPFLPYLPHISILLSQSPFLIYLYILTLMLEHSHCGPVKFVMTKVECPLIRIVFIQHRHSPWRWGGLLLWPYSLLFIFRMSSIKLLLYWTLLKATIFERIANHFCL